MRCSIICIGDELLIGQVLNTNASWIGAQMSNLGVFVLRVDTIADAKREIFSSLDRAIKDSDLIILTGGLGPTKDDITKLALAEYFSCDLVINEEVLKIVKSHFERRGYAMPASNSEQAMVPSACSILPNPSGTAPGMLFEKDGKKIVSLPGVPFEMKKIIKASIVPILQADLKGDLLISRTILTQGIGESALMEKISDWENDLHSRGLTLAYLPSPSVVRLRLSGLKANEERLNESIESLYKVIPELIYGEGEDTLQGELGKLLKARKKTVSTAESCTGGYISHLLTSVEGSSEYYIGSVITYSNQSKIEQLGVLSNTLTEKGAVSEEVVREMAKAVRLKLKTDYAISVSGIAGPGGGSELKPVGTVCVGLSSEKGEQSKTWTFGVNRERNIHVTALTAINWLRKEIENHY